MTRKTYVWDPETRKLVDKREAHWLRTQSYPDGVLPDIKDFQTQDGVHIKGRTSLREYQRRTGLEQIGNDPVNGVDEQGGFRRKVHELPPARDDVIEAFKRHS